MDYEVRKPDILPYHQQAKSLMPQFAHVIVTHIARSLNSKVDVLASIAAAMAMPVGVHCEISIRERRLIPDLGTWDVITDCVSNNPMVVSVGILPAEED